LQDQPVDILRDFFPELAATPGCLRRTVNDLASAVSVARMRSLGVEVTIGCSVLSPNGVFLGLLFVNFNHASELPADLTMIEARERQAAAMIGGMLVTIEQ